VRKFTYEARDQSSNKIVHSVIQADTESKAAKLLTEQGFIPLKIKEDDGDNGFLSKLTNKITTKDKVVFTRQLATLLGAGLPLSQSLSTVVNQTANKKLQATIQDIIVSVESGRSLTESFAKHPEVFNKVFLALVSAGEASGTLDESLKRIAAQQEKDAAVASKIRGALTYPVIVLLVISGVMAFMLIAVVPQVGDLYESLKKELPFLTQAMVNMSAFVSQFWWVVIIALGLLIFFARQYFATENGIQFVDKFKLKVPLFGKLFQRLYMARFTRTGQTLLMSGVSMLEMLRITADSVNNVHVAKAIQNAAAKVQGGKALSSALETETIISSFVPQMIKIGEQSGRIDEMLGKVAQVYEDELDEQIRTISTLIEPLLMVVLAVVAGGMVGAVLFPIYALIGGVKV
jgi:type IV pilus assembly protein PilC